MATSASPQSVGSETTILNLNDDCLREVFDLMDEDDLAAVADVCNRFRACAIKSASSKIKMLILYPISSVNDYSKLRNFGASIEMIIVYGEDYEEPRVKNPKRFIELMSQYCVGESISLNIYDYEITDELAVLMVPLFGRLQQHLLFERCIFGNTLLENLPIWSPELRGLVFASNSFIDQEIGFASLHQKFHKLESIHFSAVESVKNKDIEEFLKQNPQLKRIEIEYCPKLDDSIFQWIAKYVPDIENVHFRTKNTTNRINTTHFGQLRKLKVLCVVIDDDQTYPLSVLRHITTANIPLEALILIGVDFRNNSHQIIEEISKLQKLKELQMYRIQEMTGTHMIDMCKHLKELSQLHLSGHDLQMTSHGLLEFIRGAEKLQLMMLQFGQDIRTNINADTFKALVAIIRQRSEKTKLKLYLGHCAFSADIPDELIEASSDVVTLKIQ